MFSLNNCPLNYYSRETPHQIALCTDREKIDFLTLEMLVCQLEVDLLKKEITSNVFFRKGALLLETSWQFVAFIIAFYRLGIILIPLSTKKPLEKLKSEIKETGADFIISNSTLFNEKKSPIPYYSLNSFPFFLKEKEIKKPLVKRINSLIPILYLYTSGSSGYEKVAVFNLKNIFKNSLISNQFLNFQGKDIWLLKLPLYHVSGLSIIFRSLIAGATLALPKKSSCSLVGGNKILLKEIIFFKVTHLSLVVTQFLKLLGEAGEKDTIMHLKKLKKILIGGSVIPDRVWKLSKVLPILPTYGLTESFAQVATYDGFHENYLKILPFRKLKIDSKSGEILIEKKSMFLNYLNSLKNSSFSLWFRTGDVGEIKRGYLQVKGRLDQQFISGGENIQAEEIERELLNLLIIEGAWVVPQVDKIWGQVPIAFLELKKSAKGTTATSIKKMLSKRLEKYKIPRAFYKIESILGKINRKKLVKDFLDGKFVLLKE